jgi:cbb3-type cytochrome oxidase cytochrome c subunit
MNYGPLIFLAAFFALAGSWFGLVLTPQMQVGRMQQTNAIPSGAAYPLARPGLARKGLDVYCANGCSYCHSQQVGQDATLCDVVLTDPGTNKTGLVSALLKTGLASSEAEAKELVAKLPETVRRGVQKEIADADIKALKSGGAKAELWIKPVGADIARGWGQRRTVAEDFLFDTPVMLGSQRVGPDLANVGSRLPDPNWHLRHLYSPRAEMKDSTMPPYRFLFEKRLIQRAASTEALKGVSTEPGYEVVPTEDATALAAYLVSLRADAPLFVAPMTIASTAVSTTTNAAVSDSTNAVPSASGVSPSPK